METKDPVQTGRLLVLLRLVLGGVLDRLRWQMKRRKLRRRDPFLYK
jgi:hypothetical protein